MSKKALSTKSLIVATVRALALSSAALAQQQAAPLVTRVKH